MEQDQMCLLTEGKPEESISGLTRCKNVCNRYFFVIGILCSVAFAASYPHLGCNGCPFKPEITSSWIAIIFIFLTRGINTRTTSIKKATLFWELGLFVHIFVFVFFPISVYLLTLILRNSTNLNEALLDGLIILSALPTTTVTSIVLTAAAEGNEAASVVNATVINLTGIILSPTAIIILMGVSASIDIPDVVFKLSMKIVVPFFIGQLIRYFIGDLGRKWILSKKIYFSRATHIALFYVVFSAISQSFKSGFGSDLIDVIYTFIIVVSLHFFMLTVNWYSTSLYSKIVNNWMRNKKCCCKCKSFDIYDKIAILFLSSQKTAALGLPMIETMFGDSDNLGMYIIPLIMYHPFQLIVDSLLVHPISYYRKKFENNHKNEKELSLSMDISMTTRDNSI